MSGSYASKLSFRYVQAASLTTTTKPHVWCCQQKQGKLKKSCFLCHDFILCHSDISVTEDTGFSFDPMVSTEKMLMTSAASSWCFKAQGTWSAPHKTQQHREHKTRGAQCAKTKCISPTENNWYILSATKRSLTKS